MKCLLQYFIFAVRAAKIEKDCIKVNFSTLQSEKKIQISTSEVTQALRPPAWLKPGDKIAIVAPAGAVEALYIENVSIWLMNSGFEILHTPNLFNRHFQFAGTDIERLSDLQSALDNPEVKAIWCARGGYGTIRILEHLQWDEFVKHPKWLLGFSDITLLHALINQKGYQSIHCAMPINFENTQKQTPDWAQKTLDFLMGQSLAYSFVKNKYNRQSPIEGIITGGNLSMLCAIAGTPYDIDCRGKVLFIEEVSEHKYKIDRMMQSLRLSGKLAHLKGLLLGGFTDVMDNKRPFGMEVEEIICDAVKDYAYPVIFNVPAGHLKQNYPLPMGARILLKQNGNEMNLKSLTE